MVVLRVLDVYAGRGGLSRAFRERGHQVITLDNDPKFGCSITMDARVFAEDPQRYLNEAALRLGFIKEGEDWIPDVIVGGPPCEALSVMTIGRNWTRHHVPKTDGAKLAIVLARTFIAIVAWANRVRAALGLPPVWWWMENPRGKLRKLTVAKGIRRITVTYCQYGTKWQKPTDLWGIWPPSWKAKPRCRPLAPCHQAAPRGSRQGIQGVGYGTVKDPRGGQWTARHPATIGGANPVEGNRLVTDTAAAIRAEAPLALSLSPLPSPVRTPRPHPAPSRPGG